MSGRRAVRLPAALRGLQWRLVVSYVALVVLALALVGSLLVGVLNSFFTQQTIDELGLRARLVAANIEVHPDDAQSLIQVASETLQVRVQLMSSDNTVLIDSNNLNSNISSSTASNTDLAPDTVSVHTPCVLGYLVLSEPLTYRAATLAAVRNDLLLLGLAAAVVATILGILLGRRLTWPLRRLTAAAERMRAGDLDVALRVEGDDEIAELGRAFNAMAGQLKESFAVIADDRDRLRTFVADVSHELRTPITALRAFTELLLQGAQNDPAIRQEFLEESAIQIQRMDWLAQNLLDLSKMDAGLLTMSMEAADLVETTRRAIATNEPAADGKGIVVTMEAPPTPVVVSHDVVRLEQAISNMINNAIKFSPPGSMVTVGVAAWDGKAHVSVADHGPGISPRDLPHVFERFYRGTELTVGTSGSGLGLAIVESIVEAHGGQVRVRSRPGEGTTIDLSLPLEEPHPSSPARHEELAGLLR